MAPDAPTVGMELLGSVTTCVRPAASPNFSLRSN